MQYRGRPLAGRQTGDAQMSYCNWRQVWQPVRMQKWQGQCATAAAHMHGRARRTYRRESSSCARSACKVRK
eukprot:3140356-Lingulodinium_polyedra.AAC.1